MKPSQTAQENFRDVHAFKMSKVHFVTDAKVVCIHAPLKSVGTLHTAKFDPLPAN